jgi:hypothetical protein
MNARRIPDRPAAIVMRSIVGNAAIFAARAIDKTFDLVV